MTNRSQARSFILFHFHCSSVFTSAVRFYDYDEIEDHHISLFNLSELVGRTRCACMCSRCIVVCAHEIPSFSEPKRILLGCQPANTSTGVYPSPLLHYYDPSSCSIWVKSSPYLLLLATIQTRRCTVPLAQFMPHLNRLLVVTVLHCYTFNLHHTNTTRVN